ncbi:MAG TPA: relaxase/mobilization nuclease domain-containing protein [Burkholderiales bacterium]|nr:relaxase/mobilization nuclease domain-containing protein [Burkholderiales bacterium]
MSKKVTFRISRGQPEGINPGSHGRKSNVRPLPIVDLGWVRRMQAAHAGAAEVIVKISGGGRDAEGVQAHLKYIGRHGKLEIETDHGEVLQGKPAAQAIVADWALDYGRIPGEPHSWIKHDPQIDPRKKRPRQAFNIILSMPPGTPPDKVLEGARKFAREHFAYQHRYALALHTEAKDGHGKHPHVHLVVKAEHEYGGPRLSPRKADLQLWREQFADYMSELGVAATATPRKDRGLIKTQKKDGIYRAMRRGRSGRDRDHRLGRIVGDSRFMRSKIEALRSGGTSASDDRCDPRAAVVAVRNEVRQRYRVAIEGLRKQGSARDAQRLESMLRSLPPVQTEQQQLADVLISLERASRTGSSHQAR